jgi:hypothetical protein
MIIVQLIGGLGNQLFQYAAGKSLALHHGTNLKVDASHYAKNAERAVELSFFNIPLEIATAEEISHFKQNAGERMVSWLQPAHRRRVYREVSIRYDPDFFKARDNIYLKGYRQSEKYFEPYKTIIRKEFTIKPELVGQVAGYASGLRSENSVSVHIRRGDYLNPTILDIHGILGWDYYEKGIKMMAEKMPDAKFYFFSDDMNWVKSQLKPGGRYEFVSGNISSSAIGDFYLMTRCRHNILANSSFSWWAAWLNDNAGKQVIAPLQWYNKTKYDTSDLIPEGWTRI